ncbi:hypothetical protein BD779DRAFT_1466053 [Infundibulicybe gibba]|nr:hypothetical protein BD779DRAFT_1466053 [Infundibulicybe gibba]
MRTPSLMHTFSFARPPPILALAHIPTPPASPLLLTIHHMCPAHSHAPLLRVLWLTMTTGAGRGAGGHRRAAPYGASNLTVSRGPGQNGNQEKPGIKAQGVQKRGNFDSTGLSQMIHRKRNDMPP